MTQRVHFTERLGPIICGQRSGRVKVSFDSGEVTCARCIKKLARWTDVALNIDVGLMHYPARDGAARTRNFTTSFSTACGRFVPPEYVVRLEASVTCKDCLRALDTL